MKNTHRTFSRLCQLMLSLMVLAFAGNVFAHAGLKKSVPAAVSQFKESPPELVLTFERPVMLMKASLTEAKGAVVDFNFKASSKLQELHTFPLSKFDDGHYTVNWTTMGKDGHKMSGSYTFMVGAMAMPSSSPAKDGMKPDEMKGQSGMDHTGHTK